MTEANTPIPLGETDIEISIHGVAETLAAKLWLRMLPDPGLSINFEGNISTFRFGPNFGPAIVLKSSETKLNGIVTTYSIENNKIRGTFRPVQEPCTVSKNTKKRLHSVQFSILNFPQFFGVQDNILSDGNGGGRRLGHLILTAGPWNIDVTEAHDLEDNKKTLNRYGGYAVTHTGSIIRTDRKSFSVKEVEELLEALRLFFSFSRGAFCSPALPYGHDRHGEVVWQQWGSHTVAPWARPPSWFDTMHGATLTQIFPGFWAKYCDPYWRETIRVVLYWYLRSNLNGHGAGVDGGLILTQAALERMSVAHGHTNGNAAEKIRKTLKSMRIGANIPQACRVLRRLSRQHGWQDGPHALTAVRNELVHPKPRLEGSLGGSYYDSWNLGQRYVELMLLRLFRYNGRHGNRLTQKWRGQVVLVPWA
ncbi:MAG: hypothetical protein ABJ388_11980 [Alphaproteobacteria bacterium]